MKSKALSNKKEAALKEVDIRGIEPSSLIDWPGKIAAVVFCSGCTFRCPFCHNPELIEKVNEYDRISENALLNYFEKRKKWLDGVVITGGEPTIWPALPNLIEKIKSIGLAVKLDSNGTNPEMLRYLVDHKIINYVAMDIKAPLKEYNKTTKVDLPISKIKESIAIIMNGKVDYEFRTTIVPGLIGEKEMEELANDIRGAKMYYIQQFRPINTLDRTFQKKDSYKIGELEDLAKIAGKYVKKCIVRGI